MDSGSGELGLVLASDAHPPLNIAHRGASAKAPQNTLVAFRKALEMGADGIELDVRLSADGVPVVIHDATVDATTNGRGRVDRMTLDQLKQLDAGSSFSPAFAGERIPALNEVLETVGQSMLLNLELKGIQLSSRALEEAVAGLVERHALEGNVLISSFNPLALRRVQRIAPHIPTALLYSRPAWPALRLADLILARPTTAVHPHYKVADEQHIRWARANHVRVHVWTVDDPVEMRRLIGWGVDGIITNEPETLRRLLETTS